MNNRHVALWIDHAEAKIFHVGDADFEKLKIEGPHHHVSHRGEARSHGSSHPAEDQHFFHSAAAALKDCEEILVVGPGTAKLEFIKHVHKHDHALVNKIVGVETVDHPTEGQLVAFVRKYFHKVDVMKGIAPLGT
jgi:stalled ribosome rescue protein Dom34